MNASTSGVTSRTAPPPLRATKSATLVSAMSRPRPMTTSRSAVSDISLIRWLDTSTVRPSAGQVPEEVADPTDALGIEAVDRLVEEEHPGVTQQRGGDAQALGHPQRELARPAGRPPSVRPTWSRTSSTRPAGMSLASASQRRWLRAVRAGWNALASSRRPTSRRGQSSSP